MNGKGTQEQTPRAMISVIIPAYNCGKYLEEALASVFAQTIDDYEVIVVNDGSNDDTEAVAMHYRDRIRYMVQNNTGPSAARNAGLREARGRYVAFLDADDLWMPEKLATQLTFMEAHAEVGLTAVNYDNLIDGVVHPRPRWKLPVPDPWWTVPRIFEAYRRGYTASTPAVMVRADMLRSIGGFPTDMVYGEDIYTWFRIGIRAGWAFCDQVLCRVRRQGRSLTAQRGFNTHDSDLLFDRLRELAVQAGTEADLEAWRILLYRSVMSFAKRAVLSRRTSEAWRLLNRRKSDLKYRHRLLLELLLWCELPLRAGYGLLRGNRSGPA